MAKSELFFCNFFVCVWPKRQREREREKTQKRHERRGEREIGEID